MSVHLVGGGRDQDGTASVYGRFLAEAGQRALARGRVVPRVGVVVVGDRAELGGAVDWFAVALARCGPVEVAAVTAEVGGSPALDDGSPPRESWWSELDGLLVGGGLAPAYHRALLTSAAAIRAAVGDGLPYAGFSAGAMVAPQRALLGGWRLGSTEVTHPDNAEDLDQITVVDGLGLVSSTVDVHATQWGTLSRLVAAVAAGEISSGIAVDENTVAILDPATDGAAVDGVWGSVQVDGSGQAWLLTADDGGVRVDRRPARRSG